MENKEPAGKATPSVRKRHGPREKDNTMRKDKWNTKELIGKSTYWVGRKFKPIWDLADTSYEEAKEKAFQLCNRIRSDFGLPEYDQAKFEEGCQYREVFHIKYKAAREEFINLVFGWW